MTSNIPKIHKKDANGIAIGDWAISLQKGPILSSETFDAWTEQLQLPALPEMVFGKNRVEFSHKDGLVLEFSTYEALDLVNKTKCDVEVAYSDAWLESKNIENDQEVLEHLKSKAKPYDWTYTTEYKGTLRHRNNDENSRYEAVVEEADEKQIIDIEKLKRPDPILFFGEVLLYEDELADNGSSILSVKLRVMPTLFFVLQRLFIRVDHVIFRALETRFYHEYGTDFIVREFLWKEATYSELGEKLPKDPTKLGDENVMIPLLHTKRSDRQIIRVQMKKKE